MSRLRLALEVLGAGLYLAAHIPIALVYLLGSTLRGVSAVPYWTVIAGGYLAMLGLALARPSLLDGRPARRVLDRWLLTFPAALALSTALVWLRWPLRFPGWDAHGFGAAGGEANAVFFSWLHCALWVFAGRLRAT